MASENGQRAEIIQRPQSAKLTLRSDNIPAPSLSMSGSRNPKYPEHAEAMVALSPPAEGEDAGLMTPAYPSAESSPDESRHECPDSLNAAEAPCASTSRNTVSPSASSSAARHVSLQQGRKAEAGKSGRLNSGLKEWQVVKEKVASWSKGVGSVLVAAGWGEVGAVVPDARHWRLLRSQMRLMLRQLPLLERAGIGALAGGLAGGFTNATLHPIDTVKTRLQARGAGNMYSGPLDVVRKLSASHGLAGFYRGLPAAIVGSFVSSAIYFGTYELSKGLLSRPLSLPFDPLHRLQGRRSTGEGEEANKIQKSIQIRLPPLLIPPLSAALGNVSSSAILVPKEVIKQRLQAGISGTTLHVLKQTLREEGLQGLYSGYSAALLRNLPTNVLNFSIFEYMKAAFVLGQGNGAVLKPWQSILCGAVAGMSSSAVTTPLDVVKTRLMTQARAMLTTAGLSTAQLEAKAKARAAASYTYSEVARTMAVIFREEGAKGLTKGMGPRILYGACFSAVGFFSYEAARMFLLRLHLERKVPGLLKYEQTDEGKDDGHDAHHHHHDQPHVSVIGRGLGH